MVAFGLGTVPALTVFPALLRRLAARGIWYRRIVAGLVLAAGLWSIGMRARMAPPQPGEPAAHSHHR